MGHGINGVHHVGHVVQDMSEAIARYHLLGFTVPPGERPQALPAFVAYTVRVRDISLTERLLRDHQVPVRRTASGQVFVPAEAALGVAIIFRQKA